MRRSILLAAVLVTVLACDDDETGPEAETFVATLSGAAERPNPTNSAATGTGTLTVNANRTITYSLNVTGMTPTVQHIHGPADASQSAGVIVGVELGNNLTLTPGSFTGTVSYDSLLTLLRNGRAYFNVHSATFPAGEIRGNLTRQ